MIISELVYANVLLVANVMLLGATAIELFRIGRLRRQSTHCEASAHVATAPETRDSDRDALSDTVEQRILALQKIADDLSRKEQAQQQRPPLQRSPYENAVNLARSGATSDDLARACGLNKGEAQLMVRLYANRQTPQQPAARY